MAAQRGNRHTLTYADMPMLHVHVAEPRRGHWSVYTVLCCVRASTAHRTHATKVRTAYLLRITRAHASPFLQSAALHVGPARAPAVPVTVPVEVVRRLLTLALLCELAAARHTPTASASLTRCYPCTPCICIAACAQGRAKGDGGYGSVRVREGGVREVAVWRTCRARR